MPIPIVMSHIDYHSVSSLDALIDVSDAAARACLVALRDRMHALGDGITERLVHDGLHKKPVIAFYRGSDPLLHVFPEPGVGNGLHVTVPLRVDYRRMMRTGDLAAWLAEAVLRSRPRHNVVHVEAVLRSPARVDELMQLVLRRLELLPTVH